MRFRNYSLRKTWLDKCLNSPISEHPSTLKMSKRPKHLSKVHGCTFIIFFDHSERS